MVCSSFRSSLSPSPPLELTDGDTLELWLGVGGKEESWEKDGAEGEAEKKG